MACLEGHKRGWTQTIAHGLTKRLREATWETVHTNRPDDWRRTVGYQHDGARNATRRFDDAFGEGIERCFQCTGEGHTGRNLGKRRRLALCAALFRDVANDTGDEWTSIDDEVFTGIFDVALFAIRPEHRREPAAGVTLHHGVKAFSNVCMIALSEMDEGVIAEQRLARIPQNHTGGRIGIHESMACVQDNNAVDRVLEQPAQE
jgi:hypothetical protein